jgi:hypothetical protein
MHHGRVFVIIPVFPVGCSMTSAWRIIPCVSMFSEIHTAPATDGRKIHSETWHKEQGAHEHRHHPFSSGREAAVPFGVVCTNTGSRMNHTCHAIALNSGTNTPDMQGM